MEWLATLISEVVYNNKHEIITKKQRPLFDRRGKPHSRCLVQKEVAVAAFQLSLTQLF